MPNSEAIQPEVEYAIDFEWFRKSNRSLAILMRSRACPKCRHQFSDEATPEDMLSRFSQCCSQAPEFLHPHLPLTEAMFRLFLANENKPMSAEEISQELNRWDIGETRPVDTKTLRRLLDNDQSYGIKPIAKPRETR